MALEHLPENLRLLCSYGRSVSDVCRRIQINRQQFNRYLAGKSQPSLHSIRRICDFFGIEEHEILLHHDEFSELIRLRPPRIDQPRNPLHGFFDRLCQSPEQTLKDKQKYLGYYFYYFQPDRQSGLIYRSLVHFYQEGEAILTKQIERYPTSEFTLPSVIKHEGVVYSVSDRLIITEREEEAGSSLWHSIFYATDYKRATFMSGISLGVSPESAHEIVCARSLLEYLGTDIDVRDALGRCGAHDPASPEISDYVVHCCTNEVSPSDAAIHPRY